MNDPIDLQLAGLFAQERDALSAAAPTVPAMATWRAGRRRASSRLARQARRVVLCGFFAIAILGAVVAYVSPDVLVKIVGPLMLMLPWFAHAWGANTVADKDG
jgi:hypothetical protein